MTNPEILYVRRYYQPSGFPYYIYQGGVVVLVSDMGARGHVRVTGPEDGPVGNLIPFDHLIPIPVRMAPAREISMDEARTLAKVYIVEEQYTDLWFTQQTDIEIIRAYRAGYDAREKSEGFVFNPMPLGDTNANLLHFAWGNGSARYSNMEVWRREANAWKNPE